jgi:hypothetical protein
LKEIKIPVSPGELLDKISILELKASKVKNPDKLILILKELKHLLDIHKLILKNYRGNKIELNKLRVKLLGVNKKLWRIEDSIRKHENEKQFDGAFIELSRSVYLTNDKRSAIKNKINSLFGSEMNEIKQYTKYKE